jgi:hypothetical protein
MAGSGGYKHRKRRLDRQKTRRLQKAKENLARVRNEFESKGQAWDPESNPAQMSKLNHDARRLVARTSYDKL